MEWNIHILWCKTETKPTPLTHDQSTYSDYKVSPFHTDVGWQLINHLMHVHNPTDVTTAAVFMLCRYSAGLLLYCWQKATIKATPHQSYTPSLIYYSWGVLLYELKRTNTCSHFIKPPSQRGRCPSFWEILSLKRVKMNTSRATQCQPLLDWTYIYKQL